MRKRIARSFSGGLALAIILTLLVMGCGAGNRVPDTLAEVPRIRAPELKALMDSGNPPVIVVDTRSLASYEQAHIPGALSIPTEETEDRYLELDMDSIIVTYCT